MKKKRKQRLLFQQEFNKIGHHILVQDWALQLNRDHSFARQLLSQESLNRRKSLHFCFSIIGREERAP